MEHGGCLVSSFCVSVHANCLVPRKKASGGTGASKSARLKERLVCPDWYPTIDMVLISGSVIGGSEVMMKLENSSGLTVRIPPAAIVPDDKAQ